MGGAKALIAGVEIDRLRRGRKDRGLLLVVTWYRHVIH
jgi:hypothetical protein